MSDNGLPFLELLIYQYQGGASIRSIARTHRKSYGYIHKHLKPHVDFRPRGGANNKK